MTGIAKRVYVLADGRDLIYFDDADTALPPDRPPTSASSAGARRPPRCGRTR